MKDVVEFLRSEVMQTPGCDCERCEVARKAANEIERLNLEVEELRRDAERYRWLRKQHWSNRILLIVVSPPGALRAGTDCPSLVRLDEMIDAEIIKKSE